MHISGLIVYFLHHSKMCTSFQTENVCLRNLIQNRISIWNIYLHLSFLPINFFPVYFLTLPSSHLLFRDQASKQVFSYMSMPQNYTLKQSTALSHCNSLKWSYTSIRSIINSRAFGMVISAYCIRDIINSKLRYYLGQIACKMGTRDCVHLHQD